MSVRLGSASLVAMVELANRNVLMHMRTAAPASRGSPGGVMVVGY